MQTVFIGRPPPRSARLALSLKSQRPVLSQERWILKLIEWMRWGMVRMEYESYVVPTKLERFRTTSDTGCSTSNLHTVTLALSYVILTTFDKHCHVHQLPNLINFLLLKKVWNRLINFVISNNWSSIVSEFIGGANALIYGLSAVIGDTDGYEMMLIRN